MSEMLEQVSNYDQEIEFVIGFAGSGKSTELSERADTKTLVLTPTHKAAAVLIRKGVENVYTIHSTLKLVPTLNQNYVPGKHRMQKLKQIGSTDLSKIKNVFIDEFSMINQEILDLLLEVLPAECKVTIFGDPYQLPPVTGLVIDPIVYTENITELTTQHRAEAPEVVETFMRFMNYIKNGKEMDLKLHSDIKKGSIKTFNPETDRVLAYTNAKVLELNTQIAKHLGLPEEFSVNENLMVNGIDCTFNGIDWSKTILAQQLFPNCISKGKLMGEQELQTQAAKTMADISKWGTDKIIRQYKQTIVTIDDTPYVINYDPNHYATQQRLKADVDKWQTHVYEKNDIPADTKLAYWCGQNKNAPGVKERGRAWSEYIAHSNLVFNLQRPFATTVHKSQGSEFSTIYIAQEDIKRAIYKGYYKTYAILMYVSLSRAINKVVII